jgi:lambda family phage portal protein
MTWLDRLVNYVAPVRGLQRLYARASLEQINTLLGTKGGYDAAKKNRLNAYFNADRQSENAIPRGELLNLRAASWQLYRNNPHAKKIVRQIETKTIGRGLGLQSQAMTPSGQPAVLFRELAGDLWQAVQGQLDYRGRPGYGGQSFPELCKTALRSVVLGGDCFFRLRVLTLEEQRERRLVLPLQLQLIHTERIRGDQFYAKPTDGNVLLDGIEIDPTTGRRVAYWVSNGHPTDPTSNRFAEEYTRVPADEMLHAYVAEDVDQYRGTPWFAPLLNQLRDTGDYQYNELTSAKLRACIMLAWNPGTGNQRGLPGVNGPGGEDAASLYDADGNRVAAMQPGTILNTGADGELKEIAPPANATAEQFIQHLLRATSTGAPGIKGSTLTSDYRGSSFASERSADNEIWPEIECVQDWFADVFVRPIWEAVVEMGFLTGWFRRSEFSPVDLRNNRSEIVAAMFQGPVMRSINPKDDAEASALEIKNGTSSPQIETAKRGRNWQQILKDRAEFLEYAGTLGLEEEDVKLMLGVEPQPEPAVGGGNAKAA